MITFEEIISPLSHYKVQIIITFVILIGAPVTKKLLGKFISKYILVNKVFEDRGLIIIKYTNFSITIIVIIALIITWGVNPKNMFLALSSVFAVIGVALFAQWSLLSNITAGIILFFSVPFKIGDIIKLHDKDFPIEAEVTDITAFHVHMNYNGEKVIYPNSLLLQKGISIIKVK